MFLAIVAGVLVFFFPIANYQSGAIDFFIYAMNLENIGSLAENLKNTQYFGEWITLPLSILQLFFLIVLFINIMQFKKRILQIRLNKFAISLGFLTLAGFAWTIINLDQLFQDDLGYGIGLVLPLVGIIFLFMANYNIRKDEKLIRSANRLR
jgi:hypothetical protein